MPRAAVREVTKVIQGGYAAAEQAAWVEDQCEDLSFAADKATVPWETAQDMLRVRAPK